MSKKQKRRVSKGNRPAITPPAAANNQPAAASWSPQRSFNTVTEFKPDYTAVKKDLKRIGILAGSYFVILIALTFILR
jgi:hypothetical protein